MNSDGIGAAYVLSIADPRGRSADIRGESAVIRDELLAVRRAVLGVVTTLLVLAFPAIARAQDTGLPLGSTAPNAVVQTLDGKPVDLATITKGAPAVIEFWATWCENCEHLLPAMQKASAKYGAKVKFVAVAVSVNQSPRRVQLHAAKYKVPGVQLFDAKGEATGKWDVPATSHVVVLDRRGRVVYTGVGGDQDVEAAIRKAL
jgi:thiol-disulfide isomerase/thioredoxin